MKIIIRAKSHAIGGANSSAKARAGVKFYPGNSKNNPGQSYRNNNKLNKLSLAQLIRFAGKRNGDG